MSLEKESNYTKCQLWKKMLIFFDKLMLCIFILAEIYLSIKVISGWVNNANIPFIVSSFNNNLYKFILFIYPIIALLFIISHIKFEQWRIKCPYYKCSYDYEQNIEGKDNTAIFFFDVLFILYIIFVIHNLKPILTSSTPLHALVVSSWICAVFVLIFAILFVD